MKEDVACYSSLFNLYSGNEIFIKYRKKSLFIPLLLICGDIETQPGPQSILNGDFNQFFSNARIKSVHQIRGLAANLDMV